MVADDESLDEGSFIGNEVVHTKSTSTNEEKTISSSDKIMLDSSEIGTSTTGINLEVALEIDHENVYADITSGS